jgi:hypothetical protein
MGPKGSATAALLATTCSNTAAGNGKFQIPSLGK